MTKTMGTDDREHGYLYPTSSGIRAQGFGQSWAKRCVDFSWFQLTLLYFSRHFLSLCTSGITIWSLSDNEAEHEYWLKGQVPNLFDKDYKRKWAYKGFCDGIAGEDLGLKYGGEEYKAFYEKNNVSSTVDK